MNIDHLGKMIVSARDDLKNYSKEVINMDELFEGSIVKSKKEYDCTGDFFLKAEILRHINEELMLVCVEDTSKIPHLILVNKIDLHRNINHHEIICPIADED
jgi:hypothetical protein